MSEVHPPWFAAPRERLRRAAEDGQRIYKERHYGQRLTVAEGHRIDGILSVELLDALGVVDRLIDELRAATSQKES